MDLTYLNPIVDSTKNVLQMMAQTEIVAGDPFIKDHRKAFGVLTGVIGLAGAKNKGSLVISFEENCILTIVSRMLMQEYTELSADVVDAVGEITNMICGGAKPKLAELGLVVDMALPMTLIGQGIEIHQITEMPVQCMPFDTSNGKFVIEISLATF